MSKTNYLQELMGIIETACQDAIDYGEETWLVILANSVKNQTERLRKEMEKDYGLEAKELFVKSSTKKESEVAISHYMVEPTSHGGGMPEGGSLIIAKRLCEFDTENGFMKLGWETKYLPKCSACEGVLEAME